MPIKAQFDTEIIVNEIADTQIVIPFLCAIFE